MSGPNENSKGAFPCLAVSTLGLCPANSLTLLIVSWAFQGLSGSIVRTVTMAILADAFGSHEPGVGLAGVTLARTVALVAGPLMGGILYAKAGYYAVFYAAFGCHVLDIFLRLMMIEPKEAVNHSPSSLEGLELGQQSDNNISSGTELTGPRSSKMDTHQESVPNVRGSVLKKSRVPTIFSAMKSPRMLVAL